MPNPTRQPRPPPSTTWGAFVRGHLAGTIANAPTASKIVGKFLQVHYRAVPEDGSRRLAADVRSRSPDVRQLVPEPAALNPQLAVGGGFRRESTRDVARYGICSGLARHDFRSTVAMELVLPVGARTRRHQLQRRLEGHGRKRLQYDHRLSRGPAVRARSNAAFADQDGRPLLHDTGVLDLGSMSGRLCLFAEHTIGPRGQHMPDDDLFTAMPNQRVPT